MAFSIGGGNFFFKIYIFNVYQPRRHAACRLERRDNMSEGLSR